MAVYKSNHSGREGSGPSPSPSTVTMRELANRAARTDEVERENQELRSKISMLSGENGHLRNMAIEAGLLKPGYEYGY